MEKQLQGKNLILGLAANYTYKDLLPFIKSLKKTNFSGDIVWFVSQIDDFSLKILENEGVITILFDKHYPYFKEEIFINSLPENCNQPYTAHNLRFILYHTFLKVYGHLYSKILHADTRDVYFQKDLFSTKWEEGVYCFLEDKNKAIKDEKFNAGWIVRGFGEETLKLIGNNPISCSGVTYGTSTCFIKYVEVMVEWITKISPKTGALDQGFHNFLIYTSRIDGLKLIDDDQGEVSTLSYFKPFGTIKFDNQKNILNNKGEIVSIVHQYDRHLSLLWRMNKYFFYIKLKNITKKKILEQAKRFKLITRG